MNAAWSMKRKATAMVLGAVAVTALTLGCGASGATKAGKTSGPVVLRVAVVEDVPSIRYFFRRVRQLSHGALRFDFVRTLDDNTAYDEQHIVKYTAKGTADLAWVRTWGLDVLGVKSFQALTAPMLVNSYPLQRAVIASGITAEMLPGLQKVGVTGLAVFAGNFRKPEAVKRPLLGPGDWRRIGVQIPPSNALVDALHTLGARPLIAGPDDLVRLIKEGKLQGVEKSLPVYERLGFDAVAPYVTLNVNLRPTMWALIVNPKRFSRLTPDEQAWLRQAAADAAARSADLAYHQDVATIPALCGPGRVTRFAEASSAELSALRAAFVPAIARLELDPQTKSFIHRIGQLRQSTASGPELKIPARCKIGSQR